MTRSVRLLFIAMLALTVTACEGKELLGASERTWLWLVVPLFGFMLVGASLVFLERRAPRGSQADLRRGQIAPAVRGILLSSIVLGLALAAAFTAYNFHLSIDPRQKLWNIGFWFLGTGLGSSVALVLGMRRAG